MTLDLPRRQKELYGLLLGRGDVLIADLFFAMRPGATATGDDMQTAKMQRWLGPYITALNRKIGDVGLRVEPGTTKNTYRLVAV